MDDGGNAMKHRSLRNREFDTLEEALADNKAMAAEQLEAERVRYAQEDAATTATGCQVLWFAVVIILAFVFPVLGMPLLGLSFLFFNSGRNR